MKQLLDSNSPSFVASLRADGKPNTQAVIAANVKHLIEQLEAGHSEVLTQYLTTMARFHKYLLGNVLLIASQNSLRHARCQTLLTAPAFSRNIERRTSNLPSRST